MKFLKCVIDNVKKDLNDSGRADSFMKTISIVFFFGYVFIIMPAMGFLLQVAHIYQHIDHFFHKKLTVVEYSYGICMQNGLIITMIFMAIGVWSMVIVEIGPSIAKLVSDICFTFKTIGKGIHNCGSKN